MVKVAYPSAHLFEDLSQPLRSLKIARHSPCTLCDCTGLHPAPGITVVSDNPEVYYEADDEDDDEEPQSYLNSCGCGHDVYAHNASEAELGPAEYKRRVQYAIRIDENLQDSGRLFDFSYTDEEVKSLRKQMLMIRPGSTPTSSTNSIQHLHSSPDHRTSVPRTLHSSSGASESSLSDIESQQPPTKKRRAASYSSALSDADADTTTNDHLDADGDVDDVDEEDDVFFRESVSSPAQSSSATRSGSRSVPGVRKHGKGRSKATTVDSSSSSSSDEEGARPLASRLAASSAGGGRTVAGKRASKVASAHAGKKAKKSHHTVAGTAPAHFGPGDSGERVKANGATNGAMVNGTGRVKAEDKMDEGQLSRLAAGVAVDVAAPTVPKPVKTEKISSIELRRGVIQIVPVSPPTSSPHGPPYTAEPPALKSEPQDAVMGSPHPEPEQSDPSSQTSMSISPPSSFPKPPESSSTPQAPSTSTSTGATGTQKTVEIAPHNAPSPPYDPRSLIILTGLKTLFQKQLPKMPREYIARLVYDESSRSLAIIKRGYKVVGGICFRPFPQRGFAEIVFFATNSADQEKGYGGMLMDHFKAHIRRTYPSMHHFLTYADNFAVGYFEKQGFSKDITLKKSVWAGYIKDYEGGTIMQCTMVPKMDYLDKKRIFAAQTEAVVAKVRELSKSHVIHPGLDAFREGRWEEGMILDPKNVPGLRETGWNPEMEKDLMNLNLKSPDYNLMERTLHSLKEHSLSWPFRDPVNLEEVPDYLDIIKQPMDLATMETKLESNQYKNIEQFVEDALLIFDNCRLYNPDTSIYARNAHKLEKYLKELLPSHVRRD